MNDGGAAAEPLFDDDTGSIDATDAVVERMRRRRRVALIVLPLLLVSAVAITALAVRSTPAERAEHLHDVGEMLAHDRRFAESEEMFRRSLELLPDRPDTLALHGEVLLRLEREDEGEAALLRAVELKPYHTRANTALARRYLARGDLASAQEHAERAVTEPPAPLAGYEILGNVRLQLGDPQGALEAFESMLEIRPDAAAIHLYCGYTADFLGRATWDPDLAERARAHFQAAVDAARGVPGQEETLGAAPLGRGRYSGAAASQANALTAPGDPLDTEILLVEALAAQGALDEAEARLLAAETRAASPKITAALARLHLRRSRLGAAGILLRADPDARDDPEVWYARLRYLHALAAAEAPDDELLYAGMRGPPAPFNKLEATIAARLRDAPPNAAARRARMALVGPAVLHGLLIDKPDEHARAVLDEDVAALRRENPSDPVPLVWMAAVALREGDARAARDHIDKALQAAPAMPEALHVSGLVWGALDRWDLAYEDAERSARGTNRSPERLAAAIRAVHLRGNPETAVDAGRAALNEWPGNLALASVQLAALRAIEDPAASREVDLLSARLLLGRGEVGPAGEAAARLLLEQPDDPAAGALMEGAWERIAADYARRSELDPTDVDLLVSLARSLERAGRGSAAIRGLRDARERLDDPRIHLALAEVHFRRGETDAATAALRVLRARFPNDLDALLRLAVIERASGRDSAADAAFREVFARDDAPVRVRAQAARGLIVAPEPDADDVARVEAWLDATGEDDPALGLLRAELLVARGEGERAVALAREIAAAHPSSPEPLHLLAITYIRLREWRLAEQTLVQVLGLSPGDRRLRELLANTRKRLGMIALEEGRIEDARSLLENGIADGWGDVTTAILLARIAPEDVHSLVPEATYRRLERRHPRSAAGPMYMGHLLALRAQYKRALDYFEEAVNREPLHPGPLAGFVDAALRLGHSELALRACRKAADRDERTGFGDYLLGHTLQQTGLLTGARSAYAAALVKDPCNPAAVVALVRLLLSQGAEDEAKAVLEAAIAESGKPISLDRARTRLLLRVGDANEVDRRLLGALQLQPGKLETEAVLGRLLMDLGEIDRAEAWYVAAIEANPDSSAPYFQLIETMSRAGRVDDAAAIVRAATISHPDNPAPHAALGLLLHQTGEREEAERLLRRALELAPDLPIAANQLAWMVGVEQDRPEEGLQLLERARAASPYSPGLIDTYGWLLHRAGRDTAAAKELELATRLRPEDPRIGLHLATVLERQGRKRLAKAELERVLRVDEEFAKANDVPARIAALGD